MSRRAVTQDEAILIKDMLWRGKRQAEIAAIVGCSQAFISRIKAGGAWAELPWPDGSTGPMPAPNHLPISRELDWSADAKRYLAFPVEMQDRILEVVNTRRRDMGLAMIQSTAPEYADYLAMDPSDAAFESLRLNEARKAEDRRIAGVMKEFDEITIDELTQMRNQANLAVLESTREERQDDGSLAEPTKELKYEKLDWEEVKRTNHPIVVEAMATNSACLKEAICIIFKKVKRDLWGSAAVAREAYSIRNRLAADPRLEARLELEYEEDEI